MKYDFDYCYKIAEVAHFYQTRRGSNQPYIMHPLRVSKKFSDVKLRCVAILHDVLEDSQFTAEILCKLGIDEDVIYILHYLTHDPKISYEDYIENIMKNHYAVLVKIEDIKDNMRTCSEGARVNRYQPALDKLQQRLATKDVILPNGNYSTK